jgi:hypothetical protein
VRGVAMRVSAPVVRLSAHARVSASTEQLVYDIRGNIIIFGTCSERCIFAFPTSSTSTETSKAAVQ